MAEIPMTNAEPWERDVDFALGVPRRPPRKQPPNSGQPWTDADYEEILAAAREGVTDVDAVAERLGRARSTTIAKAKRLLPVDERAAPADRVMRLLRGHLDEPDYDWQRVTLEDPPPRPVVNPPALTGVPGLQRSDLLRICYALALAAEVAGEDLMSRVMHEVRRRGMLGELVRLRADRLLSHGAEITWDDAQADAQRWVSMVMSTPDSSRWPYVEDDLVPPYW